MFFRQELSNSPKIIITPDLLRHSNIPEDYWQCELFNIPESCSYKTDLNNYVENLVENDLQGKGLFLYGPYGSGKSGAAVAVGKEVIRRGGRLTFVASLELESIFNTKNNGRRKEEILNTHYLIFDDAGAEAKIPWSPMWVETIVKLRNNRRLPTIVTSNETPQTFLSRNTSLASIFGGRYEAIQIKGLDWRMEPPKLPWLARTRNFMDRNHKGFINPEDVNYLFSILEDLAKIPNLPAPTIRFGQETIEAAWNINKKNLKITLTQGMIEFLYDDRSGGTHMERSETLSNYCKELFEQTLNN